ncbi:LrgB family protein [Hominifimenecus sp. rT4P-3]|uniref:LrgB family protein n=1 Tax=Hominifimenecus sp. rT4P-3 TaxID=3242979 RepID=UPI003DA1F495
MMEFFEESIFFGVVLSIFAYGLGCLMHQKFKLALFNPLMLSIAIIILILLVSHIDYDVYYSGAKYLSYFLTPATVCLAVPLYEKLELLKGNWKAILAGILSGVLTSLCSIFVMSRFFHLSHKEYVTLLPKSITTAIGMGVSQELNGYVTLTVAIIIITGVLGNILAPLVCRIGKIQNPIAKGIAIGTASHAIGTAKAMEIGKIEGAMSSLSIVVSGFLTVILAPFFAPFI